jgi:2-haloacid dehalogenase
MSSDERTGVLPAVCVFDAYGTLFDLASATRRHLDALGDRAAPLADLWRAKQLEYTWLRSLMDDAWVPFEQVVADALDHAMEALALDQPATRDALLAAFRQLETYPEVPGVLTKLRGAGIRTAVLSNGSRGMLDAAVESAGLAPLLDAVLSVDDVGVFKPHPAVYRLAMEHFALAPERAGEVSFLSSNSWDAVGAAHFGFTVVWCNRGGAAPERLNAEPALEVRTLAGLLERLG